MNGPPPYTTAWRVSDGRTHIHPPPIDLSALSENERDKVIAKRKRRSELERAKRRRDKLLGNAQGNGYQSNALPNLIGDTAGQSHTPVYRHPSRILDENGDKNSANTPLEISAPHVRRKTSLPRNEAPRRDKYFNLETVTFQVGNTLFKVPKSKIATEGTIFESMPTLGDNSVEGSTDSHPVHLGGVEEEVFRAFLTVLYQWPNTRTGNDPADLDAESSVNNLVLALDLATLWGFTELRKWILATLNSVGLPGRRAEDIKSEILA